MNSTVPFSYELSSHDGYIVLRSQGKITADLIQEARTASADYARKHGVDRMLCDIREVDISNMSLAMQARVIGIFWKGHQFKKVAFFTKDQEAHGILSATFAAMRLNKKFSWFASKTKAVEWLLADD